MEIRKPQHDAIIWSEQFPNYNRESFIKSARVVQVAILMEGECIVAHLLFISIAKKIIISSVVLMNLVSIL